MLAITTSLANTQATVCLGDAVCGLDRRNTHLVLGAIAHAAGWHERHHTAHVTGTFTDPGH